MKADRLEFYRNKLRGTPVADLGRAMWAILLDATQEAEREEREECAKLVEEGTALTAFQSTDCYRYASNRAKSIRARGAA